MRLADYLPTRTFELAVHTGDLATALGVPPDVPATAAAQALHVVADLAIADGLAGPLLLAATGRPGLAAGFSVLRPGSAGSGRVVGVNRRMSMECVSVRVVGRAVPPVGRAGVRGSPWSAGRAWWLGGSGPDG
jgi:hypothetical protein